MEIVKLKLADLESNIGQIPDLPMNPRQWTQSDIDSLARSLEETPELFEARPLLVVQHEGKFVILGGNMRFEAAKHNKAKTAPAIVFPENTPIAKLKEIVVKDNGAFGAWDYDALANEWGDLPLSDWGVPAWTEEEEEKIKATEELSSMAYDTPYYEPQEVPGIILKDCVDMDKFNAKVEAINDFQLSPEQKEVLKLFAYRFIKIDFERVATYYAFNASEEEKKAIERLRLVLVDAGSVQGFIEEDMIRIASLTNEQLAEIEE